MLSFQKQYADSAQGLENSRDMQRVKALPVFDWTLEIDRLVEIMTQRLRKPGGTMRLRPIQAAMLASAMEVGGLFAPARTGAGKLLTSLLLAEVFDAKKPLLLVPAARVDPTHEAIRELSKHWKIRPHTVVSYERLSQAQSATLIERLKPDIMVADEAQCLKDPSGARWKRFKRYNNSVPAAFMSGSFHSRSQQEYMHLIVRALRNGAPVPLDWVEQQQWCRVLDSKTTVPLAPGAMLDIFPPAPDDGVGFAAARARFGRRLSATKGVVSSGHDVPDIPLTLDVETLEPSAAILDAAVHMRKTWETPCGFPFEMAVDLWRHERELSCGLYYRWRVDPPKPWLAVRREWSKFVRDEIKHGRTYDTPKQVVTAIEEGELTDAGLLERWRKIEPSYVPDTVPVWLCDSTLEHCAEWLEEHKTGLLWCGISAFGERLSKLSGVPYFREGGADATGKHIEKHKGPAICSIASCATGHNLQAWDTNYVINCPTRNSLLEQLLSRTHRDGQKRPVSATFLQRLEGDAKALTQARLDAQMVDSTFRTCQRLTFGTGLPELDVEEIPGQSDDTEYELG